MKKGKYILLSFVVIIIGVLITKRCYLDYDNMKNSKDDMENPFKINVSNVHVISDSSDMDNDKNDSYRLNLKINIENIGNEEYENVYFEAELNKEVEPYIATHILKYTSEKMNITTAEIAKKTTGDLNVYGFEHEWSMLLTAEEDLEEYYSSKTREMADYLDSVVVRVYWDGGSQEESIPVKVFQ